jgi:hypothetical protein
LRKKSEFEVNSTVLFMFNSVTFPEEDYLSWKRLLVRLPIWPQTVEDLRLIRFWLRTISNTCFQRVSFLKMFNSEFLGLLFPAPVSATVQFRAAEGLTFYNTLLPPLAYGPLIYARAVKFYQCGIFPDLLQLACSLAVPPLQVQADIDEEYSYSDRESLLFMVGHVISLHFLFQINFHLIFKKELKLASINKKLP